ncbi:MAG TPA: MarR family winged helix-turn-helix transcriptional regulator [Jatrophihabitans sp.]
MNSAAPTIARLARMLERKTSGLSLAHYRVLAAVAAGDERASRLAERLTLGKPAISAAVDALCSAGLLERTAVEDDLRATALRLTGDGTRRLAEVEASIRPWLDTVIDRTPDPAQVRQSLAWLGTALDDLAEEHNALRKAAR